MPKVLEALTILDKSGNALWFGDEVTDHGMMVFTEGECWALAWHLARLLEGQQGKGNLYTLGRRATWHHVVVRVGEDSYLDVEGLHSASEIEAKWGRMLHPVPASVESTVGAYQAWLDIDFEFAIGHSEANRVALEVLEVAGL